MTEQDRDSKLQYIPIDDQVIKSLREIGLHQLDKSGISLTILSMISQGEVTQLRADVLDELSNALGLDL